MNNALRAIELFAGAGGVAVAMRQLGIECVAHAEVDPAACETLRRNGFPGVQQIDLSTTDPDVDGPIDLLWASPPCQPFSSAGKRLGGEGHRDGFPWVQRIVDTIRPTWVIIENVLGMTHHSSGHGPRCPACYLDRQIAWFARRYAHVQTWLLDAADYGVPQHRRRVFLIAGPSRPPRPAPTHGDPALLPTGRLPWRTMGAALGITGRRRRTVEECAILQDFPPGYHFAGRKSSDQYRQVGNAVPPTLARAVLHAVLL